MITARNLQPTTYDSEDNDKFYYNALYNLDDVIVLDENPRLLYNYSPSTFVILEEKASLNKSQTNTSDSKDKSQFDYKSLYDLDDVIVLDENPRLLYKYSPTKFVVLEEKKDKKV
ncbi:unnamed protein product [Gordionus sp. m RMFG-2023]